MVTSTSNGPQNIQHAREILERWATADLAEQITSLPPIPSLSSINPIEDSTAEEGSTAEETPTVEESSPVVLENDDAESSRASVEDGNRVELEQLSAESDSHETSGIEAVSTKSEPSEAADRDVEAEQSLATEETSEKIIPTPKLFRKRAPTNPEESAILPTLEHERQEKNNDEVRPDASKDQIDAAPPTLVVGESVTASAPPEQPERVSADKAERRPRRLQKRNEQRRKERNRKPAPIAENKGPDTVNKKFRVDTPGGEPQDLNAESTAEANSQAATNSAGTRIQSNSPKGGRRHRIDTGEPVQSTLDTADTRRRTSTRPRRRYIDEPHGSGVRGPHFEVTQPKRSNLTSMTGQFLAYIGVLGLTIGTAMVIYGHFGGHAQYTPTGWLVTTVAQMMLFLGVINLVSGGIEQNNTDVSARINHLGEQLMRIEQVTEEAMRGPRIDPRRYMNADAETEDAREDAEALSQS